jgi:hypothetical protein
MPVAPRSKALTSHNERTRGTAVETAAIHLMEAVADLGTKIIPKRPSRGKKVIQLRIWLMI